MAIGNLNGGRIEDGGGNGSKERQGDGKSSASVGAGRPRATSGHGKSNMEALSKRTMSPSSQSMPKRPDARSYREWQKSLKKKSNVTDKSPSERITHHAHNDMPVDHSSSASVGAGGPRATSGHGKSYMEASSKRTMSPSSQSMPKRPHARSYREWQKSLKKNSNVTDKSPSERITHHAHNDMPVDQIVDSGDFAARRISDKECTTSLDGGEKLGNTEGNKKRYCNGKGCKESCEVSCFPFLDDLPLGVWHCSSCVRKKMLCGVHSVSEGVESIWNFREVDASDKNGSTQVQRQYFVKYKGLAHVHNRWEPESKLLVEAPSLVANFSQRYQASTWQHDWTVPDRVLEQRPLISPLPHDKDPHCMSNCQQEWLLKWRGLGYEHATWELENSSFLCCLDGQVLIQNYYTRSRKEAGDKCPLKKELSQLTGGCSSESELDKYIDVVNKLHQYKDQNAIIFDKARMMKIISFVRSFSSDVCLPFLIISTSTALHSWEKEFLSLAKSVNVVVYSENRKIREHIRELEFYRKDGSIMLQVLLTSPEVVIEDLEVLACIGWEVIVVDECQCSKVASCLEQIKKLYTGMRLLAASGQLKGDIAEYINVLSFLDSDGNSNSNSICSVDTSFIISKLKKRLARYVAYDSETKSSRFVEYWVPAVISNVQLELYCDTLLSNSSFLCSASRSDSVGALGNLLIALQKCCDHPYVANRSIQQMLLTEDRKEVYLGIGIKASGKLILLDAMLSEMKKKGLKVLILFQVIGEGSERDSLGNILDDFLCQRFGPDSYGRIDAAVAPSEKKSALDKFNKEQGRFILLLEKRACLPSIKLSSLDAIILFDSDWIPMNDVRALQKITFDMQMEQTNLFRLYSMCTMEEQVLILSTKGKLLDSNVQNIGPNTGRELLMSGASYLFTKLDEFHGHGSPRFDALEKSHLEDLLQVFLKILAQKSDNDESISPSVILQVELDGKFYYANQPLFGEKKTQMKGEDLPHVFWAKKLDGRCRQSKFCADLTPKKRRRVQYFDDVQEKSDYENAEVNKKLKKVSSGNVHHEGMPVTDKGGDNTRVHDGKKLHDSQQSLYNGLKPELAELCKVLCLPEDVKVMAGRFLEYVIHNHRVSGDSFILTDAHQSNNCMDIESKTWWQAFQISLCWTAASLVKHKIKLTESMMLAEKDLNYSCKKEEVDVAYSMLRCMKEMFLRLIQRPTLLRSSQSTESYTKGVSTSISCASSEPLKCNIDSENTSVPEGASDLNDTLDSRSTPELQAAWRGVSESVKWIKKQCNKKWRELLLKQKEENDDFRRKHEKEIALRETMRKAEEAVVRLHTSHLSISGKVKKLETEYMEKYDDLRLWMDENRKNLEEKQLTLRNKILEGQAHWIELVTSWAKTEMIKQPMNRFHYSGGLSCVEHLPSIPLSGTTPLPLHHVYPQVVSSNEHIASINLGSERLPDVTTSTMPDANITPVIPDASQNEVPCVSHPCSSTVENQLMGTGSSPDIFEGSHINTGGVIEVRQQNETGETVSQESETREVECQEQNVLPSPDAQSTSFSCNPGPQTIQHTSQVQIVPPIAEGVSFPSNQVPQNLSSPESATSEALAEDASNITAQTASQEVQTSVSPVAGSLINVSCRDPEILALEPEEQIQELAGSESPRTNLPDLPPVGESVPHGECQTTSQILQACRQLKENHTEARNEDVLSPPTNATFPSGSSSHVSSMNATSSQTPPHLSNDPLQNEIERIRNEKDKLSKTREDTRLQLQSDYNKEMEQIRGKYDAELEKNESDFSVRNAELGSNHSLALKNKMLAEVFAFLLMCRDSEEAGMYNGNGSGLPASVQQVPGTQSRLQSDPAQPTESATVVCLSDDE